MTFLDRQLIPWVDTLPDPKLVPQFRGDWTANAYEIADVVRFGTALFISKERTLATESPSTSTKWLPFIGGVVTQNITETSGVGITDISITEPTNTIVAVELPSAIVVYSVTCSVAGRVQLYETAGYAAQDDGRSADDNAVVPVILDVTVAPNVPFKLNPVAITSSTDGLYYLRIIPATASATATVTMLILGQLSG